MWFLSILLTFAIDDFAPAADPADQTTESVVETQSNPESGTPAFNSPAQVEHAKNLANQFATEKDPEAVAALDALEQSEKALAEAKALGNEQAIAAAQADYDSAKALADAKVAAAAGVARSDIEAMRNANMGWGEIAHELGIHPSALGLGQTKDKADNSLGKDTKASKASHKDGTEQGLKAATVRDTTTGKAVGHGATTGGKGIGSEASAGSHGKGSSSGGKGNGGGNSGAGGGHGGGGGKK
jgi:hypothetical protein